MNLEQHILERLRYIVILKGWDYGVLWKLGDDLRFLEWMDCCCGGSQPQNYGEEEGFIFPDSCRDVTIQHPRTTSCDLLVQLPSSMPLDSGIYAQTLMSNQARWLNNFSNSGYSNGAEDTVGTKVLVPLTFGLVEMFAAKQIPEDQEIIHYLTSEYSILLEQQAMTLHSNMDSTILANFNSLSNEPQPRSQSFLATEDQNDQKNHDGIINNQFQISQPIFENNTNLPHDINVGRIRLESPMNYFQPLDHTHDDISEAVKASDADRCIKFSAGNDESVLKEETMKESGGRGSESASDCSDDEDHNDGGGKCGSRRSRGSNKEPPCKNLVAERNRRKKLNDRLYALRALVPKISKLDRASILGDAIEYVKDLKRQVLDLQNELEEHSSGNSDHDQGIQSSRKHARSEVLNYQNGNGNHVGLHSEAYEQKTSYDSDNYDKLRQMEPQVEVAQLDGNEFFVKIFCEHKPGGFVRLIEALNSMGLEVTSVNVTSFLSLVSNVLKVERKDNDMVEADHVRDSLLEITRNPSGEEWPQFN